ncbi:hypothetical protein PLICRDRAFT_33403 [Plicaturopsis crispa FD-325 SS-3]|nr:hypothetical protein PLICRDRAFT_33403 [Plicaturopsis crispa FD-325 SS-3]
MPPRAPPKIYQLLLKTHKLTILISAPQSTTVAALKAEALDALQAHAASIRARQESGVPEEPDDEAVPQVADVDAFELCKGVREKGKGTFHYEVLDASQTVKSGLSNWEHVFIQFKDDVGECFRPVSHCLPPPLPSCHFMVFNNTHDLCWDAQAIYCLSKSRYLHSWKTTTTNQAPQAEESGRRSLNRINAWPALLPVVLMTMYFWSDP